MRRRVHLSDRVLVHARRLELVIFSASFRVHTLLLHGDLFALTEGVFHDGRDLLVVRELAVNNVVAQLEGLLAHLPLDLSGGRVLVPVATGLAGLAFPGVGSVVFDVFGLADEFGIHFLPEGFLLAGHVVDGLLSLVDFEADVVASFLLLFFELLLSRVVRRDEHFGVEHE